MSKKQEVFDAFAKNWTKIKIMKHFNISPASYFNYKTQYNKYKIEEKVENAVSEKISEIVKESPIEGLGEVLENRNKSIVLITADITLLDGTVLKNASIFRPEPKNGDESIQSVVELEALFNKRAFFYGADIIYFNTEYISGKVHISNIRNYKINVIEF